MTNNPSDAHLADSFGNDLAFLKQHTSVVLLSDESKQSQVIVAPAWQGRVMTSTARGASGDSFGWVNRKLIASGEIQPQINVFGGEDRFWLGPEGGQFSVFFAKDVPFEMEHWFTPAPLDTEAFEVVSQQDDRVSCKLAFQLTNYSGTKFDLQAQREVQLVDAAAEITKLGGKLPQEVSSVGYVSLNTVKNVGENAWVKQTGLLSIWILGMYNASDDSVVVVPYESGPESQRGAIVNDAYFGKVPADRLIDREGELLFRADAKHRSKIGLSPSRAKPVLGSYDAASKTLTIVTYTFPKDATDYVNSMWELQDEPLCGDVVNSYTDDGNLGRFFELESSSPALALKPGESQTHQHQTIHLQGKEKDLDAIAKSVLGVGLNEITSAFAN